MSFGASGSLWLRVRPPLKAISVTGVYFALALLGLRLATINESASPVWPATGFAIFAVYYFGRGYTIAIACGALAANLTTGAPLASTFGIAIGNALEALAGAIILSRILSEKQKWSPYAETAGIVLSSSIGSIVSASVGVASLYLGGAIPLGAAAAAWTTWWVGDTLGGLVVVPILLRSREISVWKLEFVRILAISALASATIHFVFFKSVGGPFLFMLFPVLLCAMFWVGELGVLFLGAAVCCAGIFATVTGFGPFAVGDLNNRLVHLQLFLASIALTSLTLAGLGKLYLGRVPTLVLLASWFLSGLVFFSFEKSERSASEKHFQSVVKATLDQVSSVLGSCEEQLRGGAGLYAASNEVTFAEWRAYAENAHPANRHAGMHGIGFIVPVAPSRSGELERTMRRQGAPGFVVKAVPGNESEFARRNRERFVIKFIEPLRENLAAQGLDVGSEQNRRAAAEKARDSGEATMTEGIVLVQDDKKTPAFLYYLPVYRRGAEALDTIQARRAHHIGWIYAPIVYRKFFDEVFSRTGPEIEMEAFEGRQVKAEALVFSNFAHAGSDADSLMEMPLRLGGRDLLLRWKRSSKFISSHNTVVAWVGFAGASASLLLICLISSLQLITRRAQELAQELTSELTASREKFREGERRLRYALDGSNDGIWDWNVSKAEMYVSGKMAETHGWPQVFRVASVDDLRPYAHPEDVSKIGSSIQKVLWGERESHEIETRYRTVDGEWRWVLTRGKISERDERGAPVRMTGVHVDIHELKRIQRLVEEARAHLKEIANAVPTLVSLWNDDLECEFANQAFASWFGTNPQNIEGKTLRELLGPEVFQERIPIFQRALAGESLHYERETSRSADGASRHVIATYQPRLKDGMQEGFYLFIQDVTEIKRAELAAEAGRRAALEAARVKSQFLANMSHEIRTPLNGIIGIGKLLVGTELSERQREYASLLSRSSESLLGIVNDILDLSKIEAGKLELESVPFDLHDLVEDVCRPLQLTALQKGLALDIAVGAQVSPRLLGDAGRIRQVLLNLLGNAVKFTTFGGVSVRVSTLDFSAGVTTKIEVTDTGIGIDQEQLKRLFQPFTQADTTTTRRFGGTGLGLSICKQLVEMMGGEIGVTSDHGRGSTFWFSIDLPRAAATTEREKRSLDVGSKPPIPTDLDDRAILIVDDNEINRSVITLTLESLGYRGEAVGGGKEALARLGQKSYALILMDCQMPDLDGYETTEVIRSSPNSAISALPIVALTANAMKGDREKCLAAGMNDYLTKPIDTDALAVALKRWLGESVPEMASPAKQSPAVVSIIDMKMIERLRKLQKPGNPDLVVDMVRLFKIAAAQVARQIQSAIDDKDLESVGKAAHLFRSSAGNMGAVECVSLCQRIEEVSQNSTMEALSKAAELSNELVAANAVAIGRLESFKRAN